MEYESEPLPSYPELRNCSYAVNLSTPPTRLFLRFIYRILIPPMHHMDRPRHQLRLCVQCIEREAGHPIRYGRLPPLDIHSDGVDPPGFHRLIYRWVFPLSACPVFCHHPCDPSLRLMMERCQDLEHIPGHHPALSSI